jgi:glutathione synthase/RimK-type ligase-like ATP-grasp enzyme
MNVLGIYREEIFSPGKVSDDKAIMDKALSELNCMGISTKSVPADSVFKEKKVELVLNMAQSEDLLSFLSIWEKEGSRIINSPQAIRNCYRKKMVTLLKENNIPMPKSWVYQLKTIEEELSEAYSYGWTGSYWIKRGDFHALQKEDVVRVSSFEEMERALAYFRQKGVDEVVVQEHLKGDIIKFYGVGNEYIKAFLSLTGKPFDLSKSMIEVILSAKTCLGLEIYGGDLVISDKGEFFVLDINDWPSFSLCQDEAAEQIAKYVKSILEEDR